MLESTAPPGFWSRLGWKLSGGLYVRLYEAAVIVPTLALLGLVLAETGLQGLVVEFSDIVFWTLVIGLVELLPVPAWRSLQMSVALPLFMGAAFTLPAGVAGLVSFLGSSDPREWRRQVRPMRAMFNRCQASLAVMTASGLFHALGGDATSWQGLIPAIPAVLADYVINTTLVGVALSLTYGLPIREMRKKLRIGNPLEFLVSYIGLGLIGVLLARLYVVGWWAVAGFVMPLLLARQMFFRTRALEDAARELKDREVVLRDLSNRMAEERQDERTQIAAYLHDDLAQLLYRMSLHIDISQKHLQKGEADAAEAELASIRETKDRTLHLIRSLIKDLHRSPLGRAGLAEALESFCADIGNDARLRFVTDITNVEMPAPVQLLCFQVARESIMNIVKHAGATTVSVSLRPTDEGARLIITDDGEGFDVEAGSPEGHFGLAMMRERAQVTGGDLTLESTPGEGSTVTAEFKTNWLVESSSDGSEQAPA